MISIASSVCYTNAYAQLYEYAYAHVHVYTHVYMHVYAQPKEAVSKYAGDRTDASGSDEEQEGTASSDDEPEGVDDGAEIAAEGSGHIYL